MNLLSKVEQTMQSEQLIHAGDIIVAAVSGGPDSVAMLHMLLKLSKKWSIRLIVAHVDHQFRGEESAREAKFVEELAHSWMLECETGTIDVPNYIRQTSLNPQIAAREKRYEFLYKVAEKHNANKIALAHHADDQAETVLMRFLRGTGISGLRGIPMKRKDKNVELIRPFLRIYKSEVLQYCKEEALHYCMDSSNEKIDYTRNYVRKEVLPYLTKLNPNLKESLNRMAVLVKEEDDYLHAQTMHYFETLVTRKKTGYWLPRKFFLQLHVALQRRLIKLILSYLFSDVSSEQATDFTKIELIRSAITQEQTSNVTLQISERTALFREYEQIGFVHSDKANKTSYCYPLDPQNSRLKVAEAGILHLQMDMLTEQKQELFTSLHRNESVFDYDQLKWPLYVRTRRNGDSMQLFGLNGSKKVKDIFIDMKIPPSLRNTYPVIVDADDHLLWIPGIRRSAHASITEKSKRIVKMKFVEKGKV